MLYLREVHRQSVKDLEKKDDPKKPSPEKEIHLVFIQN